MPARYMDRQMTAGEAVRVLIPSDWTKLSDQRRCSIASRLSGTFVTGARNADALIRAYLNREG